MRRPEGPEGPGEESLTPPALAVLALTRLAFGPTAGDIAAFNALGGNDLQRLTAWVDQQLAPATLPDAACDARIAASGFSTLGKSLTQLFLDHHVADPEWYERIRPATETELATWTRAVYSKRQLFEVLVDFWHNHFNVYAWEFIEAPLWVHHDRDVIRAHALGNFRQMLEAVVKSPAMLVYLDNYINFAADLDGNPVGSNENFAREMIELHCLGAENSHGNLPREQVPGYPNPTGYCQADVVDVARALTGWTFAIDWVQWDCPEGLDNDGHFFYCDEAHDTLPKQVLGTSIPGGGTAASDGAAVLDRLASHPAAGRFIARKLCRRLVGDFPPQSLVDSAGALFTAQWQAPDQIRQVVRHIVLSNEFRTTWGEKVKRPFEIAASALRAGGANFPFTTFLADEDAVNSFHWFFEAGGQALFAWHPPNGYPDVRGAWQSANPRVALWRLVNWLVEADQDDNDRFLSIVDATLASPARSAEAIVDFWIARIFGRALAAADRGELVDFMAAGHNPTFALPIHTNDWPDYTQDRLRSLVGLMLMSPEFLWR
ncbi:MAG: DUF1800 domain-containing protein [Thermoanaerobaculia bacterium]|nr:DUF1800 domain-containing protein [Thermoanaerobaculia bacterium]